MSLAKQYVREVVDTYIRAWETQDPDLIVTIFTPFPQAAGARKRDSKSHVTT
jgi:hypothetical protein